MAAVGGPTWGLAFRVFLDNSSRKGSEDWEFGERASFLIGASLWLMFNVKPFVLGSSTDDFFARPNIPIPAGAGRLFVWLTGGEGGGFEGGALLVGFTAGGGGSPLLPPVGGGGGATCGGDIGAITDGNRGI